jgi:hypothetical protein
LCGFSYIERYAFALYDPVDRINLNFSERLPAPAAFLESGGLATEQAVDFLQRIKSYEESTFAWRDLEQFFGVIEAMPERVRLLNAWVRRTRLMTLVMLGRGSEAEEELAGIFAMPERPTTPGFMEDLKTLATALSRGLVDAQAQLLTWERAAKMRYGVETPSP